MISAWLFWGVFGSFFIKSFGNKMTKITMAAKRKTSEKIIKVDE
jgi:hypothetical protein